MSSACANQAEEGIVRLASRVAAFISERLFVGSYEVAMPKYEMPLA